MSQSQESQASDRSRVYVSPCLFAIGDARTVILGVAGGGEDFMGYSRPDFEFQADTPEDPSTSVACRLGQG